MYRVLLLLSRFLNSYTPYIVISAAIIAFFFRPLFSWIVSYYQTGILGFIMLTMGLTLTKEDMRILASRPLDILIGTVSQFTIMPVIAWTLVHLFGLDTSLAIGIILVGCCPGGVSSNIMSYLCKGDVAYSVGMTTVNTLLSPIVTPALVFFFAGQSVDVNFWGMFLNIMIVTIIPVTVGFVCNLYLGEKDVFKKTRIVMPAFSVIGLALIVGGVVSAIHDNLISGGISLFIGTFAVVFCHNSIGYICGYFVGKCFHFSKSKNRTISIEVGMQNAGLATNLASNFFMATNPLSVVPCAISCAWHSISGTILASIFNIRDKKSGKMTNFGKINHKKHGIN